MRNEYKYVIYNRDSSKGIFYGRWFMTKEKNEDFRKFLNIMKRNIFNEKLI